MHGSQWPTTEHANEMLTLQHGMHAAEIIPHPEIRVYGSQWPATEHVNEVIVPEIPAQIIPRLEIPAYGSQRPTAEHANRISTAAQRRTGEIDTAAQRHAGEIGTTTQRLQRPATEHANEMLSTAACQLQHTYRPESSQLEPEHKTTAKEHLDAMDNTPKI
ncbi:hypothetical protein R3P38DRAFT_2771025 [Favolaschia claudopus]|uniref:Uncharacterized protein n=1 Tax=Favolaschia claudopus TaxID=2862362 RepID=A0AAW0B905_9AGAR